MTGESIAEVAVNAGMWMILRDGDLVEWRGCDSWRGVMPSEEAFNRVTAEDLIEIEAGRYRLSGRGAAVKAHLISQGADHDR